MNVLNELLELNGEPLEGELIAPPAPTEIDRSVAANRIASDFAGGMNVNENDSFDRLYGRIMGLSRMDYAVPSEVMNVRSLSDRHLEFDAGEGMTWQATDYAAGQLCDRLSKGLRSFGNELVSRGHNNMRADIMDRMLHLGDEGRKFQVRTIQPNGHRLARAVVSDAYKPIDDDILIDPMVDLISDKSKHWRALGGQLTDTHTRIRYITREPEIIGIGPNSRNWHVGFEYSNSEVGAGSCCFKLFVFDSFCENGMVFGSKSLIDVNYIHKGTRISSDFGLVSEERIQQMELNTIRDSVADATRYVLDQDFTKKIGLMVENNLARKLEGGATQQIEQIKQLGSWAGLSKTESEAAIAHWDSRESNAIGVASAITRLAQEKENYEGRVRLETAGGKLLDMPEKRWNSIMALAS